jgi:hypothetical protein
MDADLRLRIVLEKPPAGVDFGLQEGKGQTYKTVEKQRSRGKDLAFVCTVKVTADREGCRPNFLGPMVQGPPSERFVYLDIGQFAGQVDCPWNRRLKVPLGGITWDLIKQATTDPAVVLEAHIPGTGKDGGPSCATVHPPDGWRLVRPKREKRRPS